MDKIKVEDVQSKGIYIVRYENPLLSSKKKTSSYSFFEIKKNNFFLYKSKLFSLQITNKSKEQN